MRVFCVLSVILDSSLQPLPKQISVSLYECMDVLPKVAIAYVVQQ